MERRYLQPLRLFALGAAVTLASCGGGDETADPSEGDGLCKGAGCGGAGGSGAGGSGGKAGAVGKAGGAGASSDPSKPGGTQWSSHFSGVSDRYLVWAAPAPGGDVVVTGFFVGTINLGGEPLSSGDKWASADPQWSLFVARLSGDGKHVWSKRFGGAGSARPQGAAVDAQGNVALVGGFSGALTFGDTTLTSAGKSDVFVARLDSKGSPLWARQFGDADDQVANAVGVDPKGNVLLAGVLVGSADFGGGALTSAGAQDVFVAKLDPQGEHLWSKRFGDGAAQRALALAVDGAEGLVLAGSFTGQLDLGGGPLPSAGGSDAFVARLNADGEHAWSRRYGDASDQIGRAVAVDAAHRVALGGEFAGNIDLGPATGNPDPIAGCSGQGFASYVANGHCYRHQTADKTHDEARAACAALGKGWTLASLSSPDELTFVRAAFPELKKVWLGGTDTAADGTWVWDSGEPFSYAPWHEGEPNGGPNENCAELTDGKMNDLPCGEKRPFLCETPSPSASGGSGGSGGSAGSGAGSGGSAGEAGGAGEGGQSGGGAGGAGGQGAAGGTTALKSKGGLDAFVALLDPTGCKLWDRSIGAGDDQRIWAVTHDTSGNVVIAGDAPGEIDLGTGTLSKGHVLAASLDAKGKPRWASRFGPGVGQGLTLTSTPKRVMVGGVFSGQVDFGAGTLDAADHVGAFLLSLAP